MSKSILIVESDASLTAAIRGHLQGKGFSVEETRDAKRSLELIRQTKPSLVLMGVELGAGQNGYILCGKLKKDDELKQIPLVIVGSPDGFAQHKKLKTRADEYVDSQKGNIDGASLLDRVGGLIGFPEVALDDGEGGELSDLSAPEDDAISFSDILEETNSDGSPLPPEEFAVEETSSGDGGELDLLDDAFEASTEPPPEAAPEPLGLEASPTDPEEVSEFALEEVEEAEAISDEEESSLGDPRISTPPTLTHQPVPPAPKPPPRAPLPPPVSSAASPSADAAELRNLRTKLSELEAAVEDERARAEEAEGRLSVAQTSLSERDAELEALRKASAAGGKSDKEFFALREAAQKKDKEIVRIKSELNQKESEVLELRDTEMQQEQKLGVVQEELTQKEMRVKALTAQVEQQTADKRKVDAALAQAKEEGRSGNARIMALEGDLEQATSRGEALSEQVRGLESDLAQSRSEAAGAQAEGERLREEVADLSAQSSSQLDELASQRQRIAELEAQAQKHEERLARFYAKLKTDEQVREKLRKALNLALQLVGEGAASDLEVDVEEPVDA